MKGFRLFFKRVATFIVKIFFPYKMYGTENIPEGKCVIVCNHYGLLDFAPFMRLKDKRTYFLAKEEAFKTKWIARFLHNYGAIPVNRESLSVNTVKECIKVLKDDKKLVIFPEGTRNKHGEELQPIKGGAIMFATRTNSPVIPVMYAHKQKLFRKSKIIVGKPIDLSEFNGKKLNSDDIDKITEIVSTEMIKLRQRLLIQIGK